MKNKQELNSVNNQKSESSDEKNCSCGKEKRYCKGCLCDVTKSMFCYCGEIPLTEESTYTDEDLKQKNIT